MSDQPNAEIAAFVGGGIMAEALMARLLERGRFRPEQVRVGEPLAERRDVLQERYGIRPYADNREAVRDAGLVVLAIKPQVLDSVLGDLRGAIADGTLVLSIVAGATVDRIMRALGARAVVRAMPNTPGQVGEGATVWTSTPVTSDVQRGLAREVLGALGLEIEVAQERYLDMATALSGSGPAYVFLFIEALVEAGVRMGFARPVAEQLALQTVRGSAAYAQQAGISAADLRARVTSPGGTTAEALYHLERSGFRAAVLDAVQAAYHRAQELGRSDS